MGKLFVRLGRTGAVLLVGLTFACSGSPDSSTTSVQEASVVAPKGPGGASVPGVPSEADSFFQRSMGGIVACHETVGTVQPRYDEEGRCDENGQASAWTMVPQRPFVATVASFVPGDRRSATVGEYQGTLAFEDPSGRRCAWQVTLSFSGEDLLVDLVPKPGNTCSGALP